MKEKLALFALTAFVFGCSEHHCELTDLLAAIDPSESVLLETSPNFSWMRNALVCHVGAYSVATPADPTVKDSEAILIRTSGGERLLVRRDETATWVYDSRESRPVYGQPVLSLNHSDGPFTKLWYTAPTKGGSKTIIDEEFDGQTDVKMVWDEKAQDFVDTRVWYQNEWVRSGPGCLYLEDECVSYRREAGEIVLASED